MKGIFVSIALTVIFILTGCMNKPYGHYKDNEMIGFVSRVNEQEQTVAIDISEWMKRDERGSGIDDWGAEYTAHILPSTLIHEQDGKTLTLKDLRIGQKVKIIPPETSRDAPVELLILAMTKDEVYKKLGLLANKEGSFRTTVLYGEENPQNYDPAVFQKKAPGTLKGGLNFIVYNLDYVLDLKNEFAVGAFPVFLVFDTEKLVLKTDSIDDVNEFFSSR